MDMTKRIILVLLLGILLSTGILYAQNEGETEVASKEGKISDGPIIKEPMSFPEILILILTIVSIVVIIVNIINLVKAKKYWLPNGASAITEMDLLRRQIGDNHFLFWPKVLKGIGMLSIMIGVIAAIAELEPTLALTAILKVPTINDISRGVHDSIIYVSMGFVTALFSFVFYYIFRGILHLISGKGYNKLEALINTKKIENP
jgi:hypothetical protein